MRVGWRWGVPVKTCTLGGAGTVWEVSSGGTVSTLGGGCCFFWGSTGTRVPGVGLMLSWKMVASCWRAWSCGWLTWKGLAGKGFCRAWSSSVAACIAVSADESLGMGVCLEKKVTVSLIRSARDLLTWTRWHRQCSMAGPKHHPSTPWGAQVPLSLGFSCTRTRVPGGASGVRLKSKAPNSCAWAESWGLMRDTRNRFRVSVA